MGRISKYHTDLLNGAMSSMTKRIPLITRKEDVAVENHGLFDQVAAGHAGSIIGPYCALMHSPDLASRVTGTAEYIRFQTSLPQHVNKLAVLTAARELDCQWAWTIHQPLAEENGVREEAVIAIRDNTDPVGLTNDEALVVTYVQELLRNKRVSEPTFDAALKKFGIQKLVELTGIIGHYGLLACILNAFEIEPENPVLPV